LIWERQQSGVSREVPAHPFVHVLNRAFLPWCLRITEPGFGAHAFVQFTPGRELKAPVKGDAAAGRGDISLISLFIRGRDLRSLLRSSRV
jgi:hypothetical protein